MSKSEELQILSEFRDNERALPNPPSKRSNNRFRGHFFAAVAINHISKHVPMEKYTPILGPIFIKGLEWVEWDGAIVKKEPKEIFPCYYDPRAVVAIFEFKIGGIYGVKKPQKGKKAVQEVVETIRDNFYAAKGLCRNLSCFYISLHERKPDHNRNRSGESPIDYYSETKKLPSDITTCVLFNSRSFKNTNPEQLDFWTEVIEKLGSLLSQ